MYFRFQIPAESRDSTFTHDQALLCKGMCGLCYWWYNILCVVNLVTIYSWRAEASHPCLLNLYYRIAGNFRGVLIFVIFVTTPRVTKFSTHEIFNPVGY